MSRIALTVAVAALLTGCADLNEQIGKLGHDKRPNSTSASGSVVVPLLLATPPLNNIVFGPCTNELAMDDRKRSDCNLHHKIRGTTPPWEQAAAEARLMSYQPGELQCARTDRKSTRLNSSHT